jgi:aromatic ring-cleaving dioxygenase
MSDAPWHAHIYYTPDERVDALALRDRVARDPAILFAGEMIDRPVGPHPMAQYELHFLEKSKGDVMAAIDASGLRALVHPLTDDDLADHTTRAIWIGEPLDLDTSVLDPPGQNQGIPRFGKRDF